MAAQSVVDPDGHVWLVRRRWVHRKLRWRGKRRSLDALDAADLAVSDVDLPGVGVVLAAVAALAIALFAVVFVMPAVIFLLELVLIIVIVALGVAGRVLFGRPWTIEASTDDGDAVQEWKVVGWRASGELIDEIVGALRSTGRPPGGSTVDQS